MRNRLIAKAYGRQREFSWRRLADFTECVSWAAVYLLVVVLAAVSRLVG